MKVNDFLLRLRMVKGIGYVKLLKVAGLLEADWDIDDHLLKQLPLTSQEQTACELALNDDKLALAAARIKKQCRVLSFFDEEYPQKLREIYRPPIILFSKGNLSLLKRKTAVVVGSRTPTEYSQNIINKIIPALLAKDYVIASGLAKGVDGMAHCETLKNDGDTIAVIGNGLNYFYPWSNHELQRKIMAKGLIISEYLPDTSPRPYYFPQRNRILAGLSERVIVTEARKHSGSLITANLALQENRDIYAVPGRVDSLLSEGPNELIAAGASPITFQDQI